MNQAKCIGMDIHQATISVAVMDSVGKLILESILETKAATILQSVGGLRGCGPILSQVWQPELSLATAYTVMKAEQGT